MSPEESGSSIFSWPKKANSRVIWKIQSHMKEKAYIAFIKLIAVIKYMGKCNLRRNYLGSQFKKLYSQSCCESFDDRRKSLLVTLFLLLGNRSGRKQGQDTNCQSLPSQGYISSPQSTHLLKYYHFYSDTSEGKELLEESLHRKYNCENHNERK